MRDKMIDFCRKAHHQYLQEEDPPADFAQYLADYLIANGVTADANKLIVDAIDEFTEQIKTYYTHLKGITFAGLVAFHVKEVAHDMLKRKGLIKDGD